MNKKCCDEFSADINAEKKKISLLSLGLSSIEKMFGDQSSIKRSKNKNNSDD